MRKDIPGIQLHTQSSYISIIYTGITQFSYYVHIYKLYVSVYYSLFFEYMLFILPMSNKHFQKLIRFMTTKS